VLEWVAALGGVCDWCADVHPSDMMTMDQRRRPYWCYRLRHLHFEDYFADSPPLDWSRAWE
jgi:hypothetical protein